MSNVDLEPKNPAAFEPPVGEAKPSGTSAPIVAHAAEVGHSALDQAAAAASQGEAELRARVATAEAQLKQLSAKAQTAVEEQSEQLKGYVKANPLASAGIAFAVGYVLSGLFRR